MSKKKNRAARPDQIRSLDAAGNGRRWPQGGTGKTLSTNQDISAGGSTVGQRAAYYARNNSHASAAVQALISHAVGVGIKPRSRHPDKAVKTQLHDLWSRWAETGMNGTDFNAGLSTAVRAMIETGECFVHLREDSTIGPVPLSCDLIDASQVPVNWTWDIQPGNLIRSGIEYSPVGRPVAYNILPQNPADPWLPLTNTYQPTRVAAEDVCHMFRQIVPGQVRGLSWLAPAITTLRELDAYRDAALVKAKTAALLSGFIKDSANDSAGLGGSRSADANGNLDLTFEPGTLSNLGPGADIVFSTPVQDNNFSAFCADHLRSIAAGLGVQYMQISADLSGANYGSMRAGFIEFKRHVEQIQSNIIIPQLLRKVWQRFIKTAVLSGAIDAPDFFVDPSPYLSVDWFPPAWDWLDPLKDLQASIEAVNAGLSSRAAAAAEQGLDIEDLDAEIASDRAREVSLGLSFGVPSALARPVVPEAGPARETPQALTKPSQEAT